MKTKKLLMAGFLGVSMAVVPMLAIADSPSTRPIAAPAAMPDAGASPRFFAGPGNLREWSEMMDFLAQNSPNRARVLDNSDLSDNPGARSAILKRWRDYKFVSEHFPEVGQIRVQRFRVEDQLFQLELEAKADPSHLEQLRPQIRQKNADLVQLSFQERQMRIDKLKKTLAQEETRLADEQSHEQGMIDQRTDKIMKRLEGDAPSVNAPAATAPSAK